MESTIQSLKEVLFVCLAFILFTMSNDNSSETVLKGSLFLLTSTGFQGIFLPQKEIENTPAPIL